jgi:hypothetical protein
MCRSRSHGSGLSRYIWCFLLFAAVALACSPSKTPCQETVLRHLKAPATAEFTITHSDARETIGWVDSENSYGAKLRTGFVCEIHEGKPRMAFVDDPKPYNERLSEGRPILEWEN